MSIPFFRVIVFTCPDSAVKGISNMNNRIMNLRYFILYYLLRSRVEFNL